MPRKATGPAKGYNNPNPNKDNSRRPELPYDTYHPRGFQYMPVKKKAIVIGSIIGLIIFASIMGSSIDTIDSTEYAIKKSTFSNHIEPNVYEAGLYWLGIQNEFITFPKTVQTIEFTPSSTADAGPIGARTKDGLIITLDVSFNYKLIKDEIVEMYLTMGEEYTNYFVSIARDEIRDVSANYTAIEFFENRTEIGEVMENAMGIGLRDLHCQVVFLQLRDVDLPDAFEIKLEEVEIARQEYEKALREQEAAIIRAETAILEAQADAQITILNANASANAYMVEMYANAEALNITLTAEAATYSALGEMLGLNSTQLLTYLWIEALTENDESLLIVGDNAPVILTIDEDEVGGGA